MEFLADLVQSPMKHSFSLTILTYIVKNILLRFNIFFIDVIDTTNYVVPVVSHEFFLDSYIHFVAACVNYFKILFLFHTGYSFEAASVHITF